MAIAAINPILLAYTQQEGEGRSSSAQRTVPSLGSRLKRADSNDALELSAQGLERSRTEAKGAPNARNGSPSASGPSKALNLLA